MRVPLKSLRTQAQHPRVQSNPDNAERLAYLLTRCDEQQGYSGALLIIAPTGRPIAFHYTRPIKPTPLHRTLYGASLETFVRGHLIGASLLQAARLRLDLLLVADAELLVLRPEFDVPMACPSAAERSSSVPHTRAECIAETAWYLHVAHLDTDRERLSNWLERVGGVEVLVEPFERVRAALDQLVHGTGAEAA